MILETLPLTRSYAMLIYSSCVSLLAKYISDASGKGKTDPQGYRPRGDRIYVSGVRFLKPEGKQFLGQYLHKSV